jgi:pimeloyl-ACP methyl ester carboxylesterase
MGASKSSLSPRENLAKAESELLSWGLSWHHEWKITHKQESDHRPHFEQIDVPLDDNGKHVLHAVRYHRGTKATDADDESQPPLVMMHGFASGIGMWYAALPSLAEQYKGPLYAVDSFGSGLSTREKWTAGFGDDIPINEAEGYFVDALEKWRERTIPGRPIVLMGHSVGGYLVRSAAHGLCM